MKYFFIDYWSYFTHIVKDLNISPSEAWQLDLVEISYLSEMSKENIDLTVMLNAERKINGASQSWLERGDLSQQKS